MYHLTAEERSATIGVPMEGFFDRANVAFATLAPSAAAHGVPAEAPIPPSKPIPREEGTHTERVSETTPIPAKTPAFPEGVIPVAVQTEAASPILPLVISTSDPFIALSQAVNDGSSLVVTPSSIPSFAMHGPNADLSSEKSEDILKDPEDEPVLKKRISDSDEEESISPKTKSVGICFFRFLSLLIFPKFTLPSSFFIFYFYFFYTYVSTLLLAAISLLFVCLFPCL